MKRLLSRFAIVALTAALAVACATTPSGRRQLLLVGGDQMSELGATAFASLVKQKPLSRDAGARRRVECVAGALVEALPEPWSQQSWEVRVFADDTPNAFALPGGKIGVHEGMLAVARDQHQLAAVIGHEIAHVISRHGNERVSQRFAADLALQLASAYGSSRASPEQAQLLMAALGAGAQVGVLLPFSRLQEREADVYGQQLMADAGFDPGQAGALWRNMIAASGSRSAPEFLSTHPDPERRARTLDQAGPELAERYRSARASGRTPQCDRS